MRACYLAATALALLPTVAMAGETITYTYDAKGRLIGVVHAGERWLGLSEQARELDEWIAAG